MGERPRVYKTEGIILRRRNIGEADSIFTVFSDREGKFDAVARGVRKARSRMRGHLEPLTRSNMLIAQGRSLDVFTQAETVAPYRAVRDDLDLCAVALYCADLVDSFVSEHAEQPGLYRLFVTLLDGLEHGAPAWVARHFELQLLSLMGYDFQVEVCASCSGPIAPEDALAAPAAGGLVCEPCRPLSGAGRLVSLRAMKVFRFARSATMPQFAELKMDDALARELELVLGDAIRHVLEREPRTRRMLDDVAGLEQRTGRPPASVVD